MWSLRVLLSDPISADFSDLFQIPERIHVDHLCPVSSVEAFNVGVLGRFAWQNKSQVYEVDLLICPHCGGQMRFLTDIEDASVTERILGQIGKWCPSPPPRAPPAEQEWPKCSQIPIACIMEQKSNLGYQKIAIGEIKKGDQHPGYSF